ncbi:fimbrial protein [Roseateles puraquae]|jgi:major type 1 subunit fimbrin (pilin)|uniref:Ferrous iron transporter B n=1 Tax=Roseateles puraquae TaxID=431059 RepID=A0A254N7A5_9BURK|nr:fimbrial protein [Roseateles puraquae]MDG0854514.1 type 1 fimbrial protein [Roseateles puraquae]OWR03875.1 ferrous iron transporter B [Roseateles puraquae]
MFKKISALAVLAISASGAYAVDGTVTVSGNVSSATCTVTASATTVTLPTVSKTSLATAGSTAGTTPWSVSVSSCSAATMNTFFEAGTTVNSNGRLINSGTAGNVDGQIVTSTFGVVNIGAANGSQGTTAVSVSSNAATQQFYVRYYATGAATAGTFTSSFTYTLVYS